MHRVRLGGDDHSPLSGQQPGARKLMSFGLQSDESLLLLTEERAMVSSLSEQH
jgi:hypothetical protein